MAATGDKHLAGSQRSSAERSGDALSEVATRELMARVRQIQVRMRRLVNDALAGAYRSTFRGSGIEFEEVRPYQPGDDVRSIDWNRTARASDEAYVKTYIEERELSLLFVCDASPSMDFGSQTWTKREIAAQFVALLALVAVQAQDQVGLALAGEPSGLHLPMGQGMAHVSRIIREVIAPHPAPHSVKRGASRAQACTGASLAETLEDQLRILRRRTLLFVVSDFRAAPGEDRKQLGDVLARLASRHDVVAIGVSDPLEEALPRSGWIEIVDPESGARVEIDAGSQKVRAAWAAAAGERRAELVGLLRRARVDLVELSTAEDVGDPVARYFQRRGRGRRGA